MSKLPHYEPCGIYHIFNHANGRENVFGAKENYRYFLQKYAEKLDPLVTTLSYCLMPNHFHLLVKVKQKEVLLGFLEKKKEKLAKVYVPDGLTESELLHFIVHRQFHNFLGGYAKAFNKFHERTGSLLRQNTQRKIVDRPGYIMEAIRYLHLNPVYHRFTVLPDEWPYSSYLTFLSNGSTKIPRKELLEWFGGKDQFIKFHLERLNGQLDDKLEG